jgi:hypothetical protein
VVSSTLVVLVAVAVVSNEVGSDTPDGTVGAGAFGARGAAAVAVSKGGESDGAGAAGM